MTKPLSSRPTQLLERLIAQSEWELANPREYTMSVLRQMGEPRYRVYLAEQIAECKAILAERSAS